MDQTTHTPPLARSCLRFQPLAIAGLLFLLGHDDFPGPHKKQTPLMNPISSAIPPCLCIQTWLGHNHTLPHTIFSGFFWDGRLASGLGIRRNRQVFSKERRNAATAPCSLAGSTPASTSK
ncbi:hypothetical protein VTK56DRAFT_9575 [Thermocarpiscus australiensis]